MHLCWWLVQYVLAVAMVGMAGGLQVEYGFTGSSLLLSCSGRSVDAWSKGKDSSLKLTGAPEKYNVSNLYVLVILNLSPDDDDLYNCEFEGGVIESFQVKVVEPPTMLEVSANQTVLLAGNVELHCVVRYSLVPSIIWLANGDEVGNSSRTFLSLEYLNSYSIKGALAIYNVSLADSGSYKCLAENTLGGVSRNVSKVIGVEVYAHPRISRVPPGRITFLPGSSIDAVCAFYGYPLPVVRWKLNDIDVAMLSDGHMTVATEEENGAVISKLHISESSFIHNGSLRCVGHNSLGSDFATVALNLVDVPSAVNISFTSIDADSVGLGWRGKADGGGDVLYYVVTYNTSATDVVSVKVAGNESGVHVQGKLRPYTVYRVTVAAVNEHGSSPITSLMVRTMPDYQPVKLRLTVHNITSTRFSIHWTRLELAHYPPTPHQVVFRWSILPDPGLGAQRNETRKLDVSGWSGIADFLDMQPFAKYVFTGHEAFAEIEGQPSEAIEFSSAEAAPSGPINLSVDSKGPQFAVISWDRPAKIPGIIREFRITRRCKEVCTDDGTTDEVTVYKNASIDARTIRLENLLPNVAYQIFTAERTVEWGDEAVSEFLTSSSEPVAAPTDLKVQLEGNLVFNLSWMHIPRYKRGSDGMKYLVTLRTLNGLPRTYDVPGDTNFWILKQLVGSTAYEVKVRGYTKAGFGPEASMPFETPEGVPTPPRNVSVTTDGDSAVVTWLAPENTNGKVTGFHVSFRKRFVPCGLVRCRRQLWYMTWYEVACDVPDVVPDERSCRIDRSLDWYSLYEFKVAESTKAGRGESSELLEFTTPESAASPPLNVTSRSVSPHNIVISWRLPTYPNGYIHTYEIYQNVAGKLEKLADYPVRSLIGYYEYELSNLPSDTRFDIKIRALSSYRGELSESLIVRTAVIVEQKEAFPWLFVLVGCLASILLIALVITAVLLISRSRKYREVRREDDLPLTDFVASKPVLLTNLKQYCLDNHKNSDHGFQIEYESLLAMPIPNLTWEHSQMPCNQIKNRYSNIIAYDHSRVILSNVENEPGSSYINASFVDGYKSSKKFIATQGPLPETVIDFWRMVWEQRTPVIVMLTKLVEDSRVKCEQYWPEGDGLQYGKIVVTVNSVSELTDYTLRIFTIFSTAQPGQGRREIRQYHYTAWPDHGVPSHPTSVLAFTRHVMNYYDSLPVAKQGPIVVHCSAGVGRTGTFIGIEVLLQKLNDNHDSVDVFGIVCQMRAARNFMVQTESQYTFIYDAMLDAVVCGNTEVSAQDLMSKIRFLNQRDPETGETYIKAEFKRLDSGTVLVDKHQYSVATQPENKQKNRLLNVLPYDRNRVRLMPIAGWRQSDYVNASIVDGFQQKGAFIAAQAPLKNTVEDFWRMIWEHNVYIIVMLTKLEEKGLEKSFPYWPEAGTVTYGRMTIELTSVEDEGDNLVLTALRLNNKETGRSRTVTHYWYTGWPESGSPESGSEIIQLIGAVQKMLMTRPAGPVVVHCSGGVGRTGAFIAVWNSIEKLKAKNVVDVFQTVRALRMQRTAMVQTVDQYFFCYQALKDYLDSFDLYANVNC